MKEKRFVVRKYIMAKDALSAIKKDKKTPVDDVWVDEDWKKLNDEVAKEAGFKKK